LAINDPSVGKKLTRCCGARPEVSQENKPSEKPGEWHYKCPLCKKDPCMTKMGS